MPWANAPRTRRMSFEGSAQIGMPQGIFETPLPRWRVSTMTSKTLQYTIVDKAKAMYSLGNIIGNNSAC